jgi:hypothetical protein
MIIPILASKPSKPEDFHMATYLPCVVCGSFSIHDSDAEGLVVDCFRCGRFRTGDEGLKTVTELKISETPSRSAMVSGWIREHQGEQLRKDSIEFQLVTRMPSVGQKAEKLLRFLGKSYPHPGTQFEFNKRTAKHHFRAIEMKQAAPGTEDHLRFPLSLQGASYAHSLDEVEYLLLQYLVGAKGYLIGDIDSPFYSISPAGWAFLEEVVSGADSDTAFIAMWFSTSTNSAWETGVYPGVVAAGYKPFRIDKHDHNNRIDDEIIASIKRSRFLIADFTGQRGGVYFEAGFALGHGLPVVWLCKHSDLHEVHFDTRQYNMITWSDDKLADLAKALQLRIEATIGRGPHARDGNGRP